MGPKKVHASGFNITCLYSIRDLCKAGGFEDAILGPKKVHASGFNITCLYSIIRMQLFYMPCLGKGKFCNIGPCRSKLCAASTFGQLQGTGLTSKLYDFRLYFWDRFLGRDLKASSSKVANLRAALQAEFWSHGNSTFWES